MHHTKHVVIKNHIPARDNLPENKWVANCEKLAGGWADKTHRLCYSLQSVRTDNSFPYADQSAAGAMIKGELGKTDGLFRIDNMQDFYYSINDCRLSCGDKPYCNFHSEKASKDYVAGLLQSAKDSKSSLATCTFNIPVIEDVSFLSTCD
jgi:hypothetical protein